MYLRRLRDLREDHDLSQTQVAELLRIQQTVYSRYERGAQTIPLQHLVALAQYSRMEKTLSKDPELYSQYNSVLEEYLSLDHMED